MRTYTAVAGDRFDSIFFRFYSTSISGNSYTTGYNAFVLANIKYIDTPIFRGGETILLPIFDEVISIDFDAGIW